MPGPIHLPALPARFLSCVFALVLAVALVVAAAALAAHRCSRPFPPDPVLVPLSATLEPGR